MTSARNDLVVARAVPFRHCANAVGRVRLAIRDIVATHRRYVDVRRHVVIIVRGHPLCRILYAVVVVIGVSSLHQISLVEH